MNWIHSNIVCFIHSVCIRFTCFTVKIPRSGACVHAYNNVLCVNVMVVFVHRTNICAYMNALRVFIQNGLSNVLKEMNCVGCFAKHFLCQQIWYRMWYGLCDEINRTAVHSFTIVVSAKTRIILENFAVLRIDCKVFILKMFKSTAMNSS